MSHVYADLEWETKETEFTAQECMHLVPVTVVNVYVMDEKEDVEGKAVIPECCHGDAPIGMISSSILTRCIVLRNHDHAKENEQNIVPKSTSNKE